MQTNVDIAIVGAGIVGASCAALLAKDGFKVALIDANGVTSWQSDTTIGRVSSLNQGAKRIFQHLDIWSQIQPFACDYRYMHVWQQHSNAKIDFDSYPYGYKQFAYIIENALISSTLIEQLKHTKNALLSLNNKVIDVDSEQAILYLEDGAQIHSQLIIAADGANSRIRQLCHIPYESFDYAQRAIVCNVTLDNVNACEKSTAWQCFLDTGPLALLPLYNGQYSMVWSCLKDKADELMSITDTQFCHQLTTHIQSKLHSNVTKCSARLQFPIVQRHCQQYFSEKVVLIGDAAHTTHPLAGIGANLGLLDAAALAQTLHTAKQQNQRINKTSLLASYNRWRQTENTLALTTMRAFNSAFTRQQDYISQLAGLALTTANHLPIMQQWIAQMAMANRGDLPTICRPKY